MLFPLGGTTGYLRLIYIMQEKQIKKFVKGELNSLEKREVIEWIRSHADNQKKFNLIKAKHVASKFKNITGNNSQVYYKKFSKKVEYGKNYKYTISAIAIVIVSFLVTYYFNSSIGDQNKVQDMQVDQYSTIISKEGNHKVILPDGSTIILNVDSKLVFPKIFSDSLREVTLTGEAFFEIAHNADKPFIVNANEIKIKVLGTSFNVKSYSKDEKIETTLVTGKVELIKDKETPVILAPSQKAVFFKSEKKLKIEEVNSSNIIAWKDGKLIFNNTSMEDVIIDLERKYDVQFIINSPKLLAYEYTGTFDNLSIEEVLDLLVISSPIKHLLKDEKIVLDMK